MNNETLEIITSPGGRDGRRILVLKGRLIIETVATFQDAISGESAPELIIDMSGVPSMDSAGLGVMIVAYVRMKKASRKLSFAGMNEHVKAVIDTTSEPGPADLRDRKRRGDSSLEKSVRRDFFGRFLTETSIPVTDASLALYSRPALELPLAEAGRTSVPCTSTFSASGTLAFRCDGVTCDKTSCAFGAPQSMKIGFSGLVLGGGSVCDTSIVGWRLLGGR